MTNATNLPNWLFLDNLAPQTGRWIERAYGIDADYHEAKAIHFTALGKQPFHSPEQPYNLVPALWDADPALYPDNWLGQACGGLSTPEMQKIFESSKLIDMYRCLDCKATLNPLLRGQAPKPDRGTARNPGASPLIRCSATQTSSWISPCALEVGREVGEPYGPVLGLLIDGSTHDHGRAVPRQSRSASYKQLAKIAHLAGMSRAERITWYTVCRATYPPCVNPVLTKLSEKSANFR